MKIAVLGAGRIGSVFAFHLARVGHEVTVVARGTRLEALRNDNAIVTTDGRVAPAHASPAIDPATAYDLVIVTVPEYQMDPLVSQLAASAARQILLMFNSFYGPGRYRDAIGAGRLTSGFPNMKAFMEGQRLSYTVDGPGMVTTLATPELAALFKESGLPSEVEPDMDAFLRSHAAMVVPIFTAGLWTWQRSNALTWAEAKQLTLALTEGLNVVRALGFALRPRFLAAMSRMPVRLLTLIVWRFCRSSAVRDLGQFGPQETRWLIDAISDTAAGPTPYLHAIRP